jgi:excisionase family DNA binding protein
MPDWPSCSVEEAARLTGYHPEHIRRLLRANLIEHTRIGPSYLIKTESLMAYVRGMEATGDARTGPKGRRK